MNTTAVTPPRSAPIPVCDLRVDAPRYVVEALKVAKRPVDAHDLTVNYRPPTPNNMAELKADQRHMWGDTDVYEVKYDLIVDAVEEINRMNSVHEFNKAGRTTGERVAAIVGDVDDGWQFSDGVNVDELTDEYGAPYIAEPILGDPFNPETGIWKDNIRTPDPQGYKDLRESMQKLGWRKELPAIKDERGVIIVGHRRLNVAKELGIEPVIKVITYGEGDAADAERLGASLASNTGFEKLSADDRKKIAAHLYTGGGGTRWSMERIAERLHVATKTISRDLSEFDIVKSTKAGRPRKPPSPPAPAPEPPAPESAAPPGGVTTTTPGNTERVTDALTKARQPATVTPIRPDINPIPVPTTKGTTITNADAVSNGRCGEHPMTDSRTKSVAVPDHYQLAYPDAGEIVFTGDEFAVDAWVHDSEIVLAVSADGTEPEYHFALDPDQAAALAHRLLELAARDEAGA